MKRIAGWHVKASGDREHVGLLVIDTIGEAQQGNLHCNGMEISRLQYPDLLEEIGETYGKGDGVLTFNLPNFIDIQECDYPEDLKRRHMFTKNPYKPPEGVTTNADGSKEDAVCKLRQKFPHGHPRFAELVVAEMELHNNKNHDYAHGGDPLGNFYRASEFFTRYPDLDLSDPAVVAMVWAFKQIDAFFWLKASGHAPAVEGIMQRLADVSCYAKLAIILEEEEKRGKA